MIKIKILLVQVLAAQLDASYQKYAPTPSPQTDTPSPAAPGQNLYNYTLTSGRFAHGTHRLYTAENTTLSCAQQSEKDWKYLWDNLEVSLTGIVFKDRNKRSFFEVVEIWMKTTDTSCVPYVTYGLIFKAIRIFPFV